MWRIFQSKRVLILVILVALLVSCGRQDPANEDLYSAVDELYDFVITQTGRFHVIAEIDHSRLAAAEGEVMPPARVLIFSDSSLNTSILSREPLAGLDLPFRVLTYAEEGSPAVMYTTADFLQRRYGLENGSYLQRYDELLIETVRSVPVDAIFDFDTTSVSKGEGIVTLDSRYAFEQTIEQLKGAIMKEGDTVWFGEIDYQQEATRHGVDLPPLTLLLWGAPAPGAKAMREHPRMGLDAFCQKTLVYQIPGEGVQVSYNEMTAFAEMHYGDSALPHRVITRRMLKTLGGAVSEDSE